MIKYNLYELIACHEPHLCLVSDSVIALRLLRFSWLLRMCFFVVDVSRAGEGQLEIMVNRGSVPNNVRMVNKTLFTVSFVPREPIPHIVEVKFNGEPIPRMFLLDEKSYHVHVITLSSRNWIVFSWQCVCVCLCAWLLLLYFVDDDYGLEFQLKTAIHWCFGY